MNLDSSTTNNKLDIFSKIIPTEIIFAYLAIINIISDQNVVDKNILYGCGIVFFILTPFYQWLIRQVKSWKYIIFSTLTFPVWWIVVSYKYLSLGFPLYSLSILIIVWGVISTIVMRGPND